MLTYPKKEERAGKRERDIMCVFIERGFSTYEHKRVQALFSRFLLS
jgi:hypothetical protein